MNTGSNIYYGVVEERATDPLKLGRCRVRVVGIHTENKLELPTASLPWAYVMAPINSASMNGIGHSPTGVVEGTWCVIIFRDADKQQPVIIGSLGGIPEEPDELSSTNNSFDVVIAPDNTNVLDGSGNALLDGSGNPVSSGSVEPNQPPTPEIQQLPYNNDLLKPGALKISPAGLKHILDDEAISSLVKGSNKFTRKFPPDNTILYSYLDSNKIWTIGVGSIYMQDGRTKVTEDSTMSVGDARKRFADHVAKEVEKQLNRNLKAPVTQDMFDAMGSISYNMGVYGFMKSTVFSSINGGRYEEAGANIEKLATGGGNGPRRKRESALFLSGGIPGKDNSKKAITLEPVADKTTNPVIRKPESASITPGGAAISSTQPVAGSTPTGSVNQQEVTQTAGGFSDPDGIYPKKDWYNEPDTHRLARNEKIDQTIVFSKEAGRVRGVKTARGSWDQPPVPYNAQYPYNQTRVTESGHVEEWDDTEGNERIHRYHKAGTYEEIDKNGTRITRIIGDDYEILERNGHLLIKGTCNITVMGNSRIRVENDSYLEVLGNMYTDVTGNMETTVGGHYKLKTGSTLTESMGVDHRVASGLMTEQASAIHMNSGNSETTGLSIPTEGAPGEPEFAPLRAADRTLAIVSNYDTPEDGDNTAFLQQNIDAGRITEEDVAAKTESVEETPPEKKPNMEIPKSSCDGMVQPFNRSTRLSANYTMGNHGTGIPSGPDQGLSAADIGCNMKYVAENVTERIRARFPNVYVTSNYRSTSKNASTAGASKTSPHLRGSAVDVDFPGFTTRQKYEAAIEIQKILPVYDKIILEYSGSKMWIHVALNRQGNNRGVISTMDVGKGGKTIPGKFVLLK